MLVIQLTAIQTLFGRSCTVLEHRFKDVNLYYRLGSYVSRYVLGNIVMEEQRCRETLCMDKEICGCVYRTSYGLPCAYFIATKIRDYKPVLLDEIHIIGISYVWMKKVMKIVFLSCRSGIMFKNVSRKSLIK